MSHSWADSAERLLQGDGDAGLVTARLTPLQRDSPEEQAAQLPVLATLALGDREALATRQPPTDEPSFLRWCHGLGVEVPAAPDSLTEALVRMAVR